MPLSGIAETSAPAVVARRVHSARASAGWSRELRQTRTACSYTWGMPGRSGLVRRKWAMSVRPSMRAWMAVIASVVALGSPVVGCSAMMEVISICSSLSRLVSGWGFGPSSGWQPGGGPPCLGAGAGFAAFAADVLVDGRFRHAGFGLSRAGQADVHGLELAAADEPVRVRPRNTQSL